MISIAICPVCKSTAFENYLTCKDYTVTQERFQLVKCNKCTFVITSPKPASSAMDRYYQSDRYISHSDTAATFFDKIYLMARNYTLKWKLSLINSASDVLPDSKKILDFGCGTGYFLNTCKNAGWEITGLEPSQEARAKAQQSLSTNIYKSIELIDKNFDVITLWHVLEHVPNLNEVLQQLRDKLTKNGRLLIAVPNHTSWDGKYYKEYWAGYDVPRHLWHFSQDTMKTLLNNNSLELVDTVPMRLDAFYISLLSEQYKNGDSGLKCLINAVLKGIKSNYKAKKTGEYSSLIYIIKK